MKFKPFLQACLAILILLATAAGVVFWLSFKTPMAYQRRVEIPDEIRVENLKKVEEKKETLLNEVKTKPKWEFVLSEVEANSWLASPDYYEELAPHLPPEISDPRIQLKEDELILAFRVTHDEFSGVVTAPLKVESVTADEVQIRIESLRTGLLPFSWQEILEETLSEQRDSLPVGITWNKSEEAEDQGTLITVQLDQLTNIRWQLDEVRLETGFLYLIGSRREDAGDEPQSSTESEPVEPDKSTSTPGG
ncbi:MAG: hypothetical protein R3C11_10685 [Planctomycetaceae bacterium]